MYRFPSVLKLDKRLGRKNFRQFRSRCFSPARNSVDETGTTKRFSAWPKPRIHANPSTWKRSIVGNLLRQNVLYKRVNWDAKRARLPIKPPQQKTTTSRREAIYVQRRGARKKKRTKTSHLISLSILRQFTSKRAWKIVTKISFNFSPF